MTAACWGQLSKHSWFEGEPVQIVCDLFTLAYKNPEGTAGYIINAPYSTKRGKWKGYVKVFLIGNGNVWVHTSMLTRMPFSFDPRDHNAAMKQHETICSQKKRQKRTQTRQRHKENRKETRQAKDAGWAAFLEQVQAGALSQHWDDILPRAPRKCHTVWNKYVDMPRFRSLLPKTVISDPGPDATKALREWIVRMADTSPAACSAWLRRHSLAPHENFAEKHCWWHANAYLTGVSVAEAQKAVMQFARDSAMIVQCCNALMCDRMNKERWPFEFTQQ